MTDHKPTDYAAIIRATQQSLPEPPSWLNTGKQIYSVEHGIGEVMAILGKRLIVRFLEDINPIQFSDWTDAILKNQIRPTNSALTTTSTESTQTLPLVSTEQIQAIPHISFQAIAQELSANLAAITVTEANTGELYSLPDDLPIHLRSALIKLGINNLYSHQIEALKFLRSGLDVSISTQTASGKTLCYNLAVLESCLQQPETTGLYIFPLKALAVDQMGKLSSLVAALETQPAIKVGLMTGDTPKDERQRLFFPSPPNILAVSPDLLHHHLYNLRRQDDGEPWRAFLRQLRWVVIDESHTYTGSFGSHFTNLMRRLRLAVDTVGGNSNNLQFICTTATVGNPEEMALRFSGRTHQPQRLRLIDRSGAENAGRTLLSLKPSNIGNPDACKIIIALLKHDLSGIVFCNSRAAVKDLLGLIQRETQRQGISYLAKKVAVFYGSLKDDRRHEIVQKLQQNKIKVIISTSALEAGIDLPQLDFCLLRGFPGSIMSFWQRLGRSGRANHGLVIFLPIAQNPLDAFYGKHPQHLLSGKVEKAAFNADYATILSKHLECSCVESGLPLGEVRDRFGDSAGTIIDSLLQQDKLFLNRNNKLWGRNKYPHKDLNIRSSAHNSVNLIDKDTGEVLEKMNLTLAYREVFPNAIYTLQSEEGTLVAYRCESLDLERSEAILKYLGKEPDILTQAIAELDIKPLSKLSEPRYVSSTIAEGKLCLTLTWAEITTLVTGYQLKSREYGLACVNQRCPNYRQPTQGKTCSVCKRSLREAEIVKVKEEVHFEQPYKTHYQAPCLKIEINPPLATAINEQISKIKEDVRSKYSSEIPEQLKDLWLTPPQFITLHSMEHQLTKAVPLVVLASSLDIDSTVDSLQPQENTFGWLFDSCDGGTGVAEALFQDLPTFATKALALANSCDCDYGCPRCLTEHGCPQENSGLNKDAGLFLLEAIASTSTLTNL